MSHHIESEFKGVIGRTYEESTPWWREPVRAKEGAPNVMYIVLDDVGFAQLGCYGSDIETPNMDRLAANGLLYNNFHTTALCSPTRSCLLTGRNHHSNHMAGITEIATGFPGYDARIPKANGFLSEMLVPHGYAAYAVGKWHLTPDEETNMAATRERWPLGRGFERFYGFLGGETHQYDPDLVYDNHLVEPPRSAEEGYHLTEDLADKAIEFIQDLKAIAPDKPFFMYFCTGACHAPHHAPREWIERYRGRFDKGWDRWRQETYTRQLQKGIIPQGTELSPRPPWVQEWESLPDGEKRLYARMMEVYAAFLSHTDHHIGRLIDFLDRIGELDNTLVVLVSDNGASAEGGRVGSVNENRFFNAVPESLEDNLAMIDELGGPNTWNHYPWGWTWAGNTPLKRWKRETHQGGMTDPMIVHWPKGVKARGEMRSQYCHAVDVVPTLLEVLKIEPLAEIRGVAQSPIEGLSFAHTFDNPTAPSRKEVQYYEMLGCRAIWYRGWKAVTYHQLEGSSYDGSPQSDWDFDRDRWELYNVDEDFSECHDLAEQHPDRLRQMIERWWSEAGRYNVLPLDDRGVRRLAIRKPQVTRDRDSYLYYPGASPVPEAVAVNVRNRSHTIAAEVEIPEEGAEGVLLAHGSIFGGYTLYVKNRRLVYVHNYVGVEEYRIVSETEVPAGAGTLRFEFTKTGEHQGTGALFINGTKVGEGRIPRSVPIRFSLGGEGLCCGYDSGIPATRDYRSPFRFTGTIKRAVVNVSGKPHSDFEREAAMAMSVQ